MTSSAGGSPKTGLSWLVEFVKRIRLAWRLVRDPLVPVWVKLIPLAALAYVVLSLDLIPDWVLGLGQVDDLGLLLLGLKLFIDFSPPEVVQRHMAQMSAVEGSYRIVEEEQPTSEVARSIDRV